jgi:hypothetical protein
MGKKCKKHLGNFREANNALSNEMSSVNNNTNDNNANILKGPWIYR